MPPWPQPPLTSGLSLVRVKIHEVNLSRGKFFLQKISDIVIFISTLQNISLLNFSIFLHWMCGSPNKLTPCRSLEFRVPFTYSEHLLSTLCISLGKFVPNQILKHLAEFSSIEYFTDILWICCLRLTVWNQTKITNTPQQKYWHTRCGSDHSF